MSTPFKRIIHTVPRSVRRHQHVDALEESKFVMIAARAKRSHLYHVDRVVSLSSQTYLLYCILPTALPEIQLARAIWIPSSLSVALARAISSSSGLDRLSAGCSPPLVTLRRSLTLRANLYAVIFTPFAPVEGVARDDAVVAEVQKRLFRT